MLLASLFLLANLSLANPAAAAPARSRTSRHSPTKAAGPDAGRCRRSHRRVRPHRRSQEGRRTKSRLRRPSQNTTDIPQFSLHVDVPVVTVDAQMLQKDGRPLGTAAGRGAGALQGVGRRRAAEDPERHHQQGADHGGAAGGVRGHQLQLHVRRAELVVRLRLEAAAAGLGGGRRVRHEDAHPGGLHPGQAGHLRRAE